MLSSLSLPRYSVLATPGIVPAILSLPPCHPAALGLQKLAGRIPETHGKGGQRIGALFQNRIKENPPGYTPPLLKNPFFFCFYFAIILSNRLNISKFAPKNFFRISNF